MSGHSPEEIRKSVKSYMVVFGILIIGTIVTVLALSLIHISEPTRPY